jgi:hypothetical protein
MEALNTSETSVNFYKPAQRNIPSSYLKFRVFWMYCRRRENLKSHIFIPVTVRTLHLTETETLHASTEAGLDVRTQGKATAYYKDT